MIRIALRASPLVALCAVAEGGCKKEQESLVVASLQLPTGSAPVTNLKSVTLSATPGRTATFDLAILSPDTPAKFGVYLPESVTRRVGIVAIAVPQSGCAGLRGNGGVVIDAPGVTRTLDLTMVPHDTCSADGGTAGSGGTTGNAGSGGSSGGAAAGTGGGTAGAAGTGIAGAAGTGIAGSGGSSSAGSGGTGTTGTAGAAGRGGAGGAAGGAGGMAGYPSIASCRTFAHGTTACPNHYVYAVAIAPNGQIVASAGTDGRVKIWSFDGRQLTATGNVLTGFTSTGLAFSPDGTRLAHTAADGSIRTYTVDGWAPGTTLLDDGSHNTLRGVAFTPDSQRVVSVNAIGFQGGDLFVHNLSAGSALPTFTTRVANEPYTLAVSPRAATDGSVGVIVGSYYGTSTVYSLSASGFSPTFMTVQASMSDRTTYSVRFSPDGSLFVTGENYGAVRFFPYPLAATSTQIGSPINFAGGDSVSAVAFSPSGKYLAVGGGFSNAQLSIYDASSHAELDRTTPTGNIDALVFAPNGNAIIAGTDDCATVLVCN